MNIYVTSASFEPRCLALVTDAVHEATDSAFIILDFAGYESVAPYVFNRQRMVATLLAADIPYEVTECRLQSPLSAELALRTQLAKYRDAEIVLDISTLPRNYLLVLAAMVSEISYRATFRYYRPEDYGEPLSRGIRAVRAVPGYEGLIGPDAETWLLVIMGFEGFKALHAWEVISPTHVRAFIGDPPFAESFKRRSLVYNQRFLEEARIGESEILPLHTSDALLARDQLQHEVESIRAENPAAGIVVCPLGTKLQTLSLFAVARRSEGLGVAYVSSRQYFTGQYSSRYVPRHLDFTAKALLDHGPVPHGIHRTT